MEYFKLLISRAGRDTWEVVFGMPLRGILIASAIFVVTLLLHWNRKGLEDMKEVLFGGIEGAGAATILFSVFFLLHVFVLTPKNLVEESQRPTTTAATQTLQSDVAIRDEREWPPLTDTQIEVWARTLDPSNPRYLWVCWGHEVQAVKLFRTLQEVAKNLKCSISSNSGSPDKQEIRIRTIEGDPAGPPLVELFQEYVRGLNFPVKLEIRHPMEGGELGAIQIWIPESPKWPQPQRFFARNRESRANRDIVAALAISVRKGVALEKRYTSDTLPTQGDLDAWRDEVIGVLEKPELGDGYVARFDSAKGFEGIYPVEIPMEDAHRFIWLEQRVDVLGQFIKELSQ